MSGNYNDSLNQGLQIGRLTGELAEVQGKAATAGIRAVDNETQARTAKKALAKEREANEELRKQLDEQKALTLEWMHANESFKRMFKIYTQKANISDEQRTDELQKMVIIVAEENPLFRNTRALEKAKKHFAPK
jgi:predicted amino acid dehydrogenase